MSRARFPYGPSAVLNPVRLLSGELATDVSEHRIRVGDGVTPGGVATARLDEVRSLEAEVGRVAAIAEAAGTTKVVETVAQLASLTGVSVGDRAEVRADPGGDVAGCNGVWRFVGPGASAWVWIDSLVPAATRQAIRDEVFETFEAKLEYSPDWQAATVQVAGRPATHVETDEAGRVLRAAMADGTTYDAGLRDFSGSDPNHHAVIGYDNGVAVLGLTSKGRAYLRGQQAAADFPDISMVLIRGQSNAGAAESLSVVTTEASDSGDLMFATGIQQWHAERKPTTPEGRGVGEFELVPLREGDDGEARGEFGALAQSSQFKLAACGGRYAVPDPDRPGPRLLFACPDTGGRHLSELTAAATTTGHWKTFVEVVRRGKAEAEARALSFGVIALDFCQGETDGGHLKLVPGGPTLTRQQTIDGWSAAAKAFRADMEAAIKAETGQTRRLPMFVTQVLTEATATAQDLISREDPDIYLVGPIYPYPSAINSASGLQWFGDGKKRPGSREHFSADARAWHGEQKGKVMRRVLKEGRNWTPLRPAEIWRVDDTRIRIRFDVPAPPIRFNVSDLIQIDNYGFEVLAGTPATPGTKKTIQSVAVISADTLEITLAAGSTVAASSTAVVRYAYDNNAGSITGSFTAQAGAAYANGDASTELVFTGDVSALPMAHLKFGAFMVATASPAGAMTITDCRVVGGKTYLRGRDVSGTLVGSPVLYLKRDNTAGNLSDSDDTLAHYSFRDARYGTRQGQLYPLSNFCIQFLQPVRTA